MEAVDPRFQAILDNALFAITEFGPLCEAHDFDYDQASVAWVEGFIERQRIRLAASGETAGDGIVSVIGSFLGEAIIAAAGGNWAVTADGDIGLQFENGAWCFPFTKVRKQFEHGLADAESILSFYNVSIEVVAKGLLGNSPRGEPA